MSFTIQIGKVTDPDIKINKVFSAVGNHNGTLKSNTSVLQPTILLKASLNDIKDCNYMIIDKFARKYFITDIVSVTNELVEVSGRVDVLSTYSQQILSNTAIFKKSQTLWNKYIDDGGILKLGYDEQTCTKFPGGFTDKEFILAVAGR